MPRTDLDKDEDFSGGSLRLGGGAAVPWWLSAVVVIGSLLMILGGVIALVHPALLVSPHDEINGAFHIYAGYLASRNLSLAIMLLAALLLRAQGSLHTLMILTGFVQILDACIDCVEGRWAVVPGVAVFGAVLLVGSARLSGHAFWRAGAWGSAPDLH